FVAVLVTLSPWAPIIVIIAAVPGAIVNFYFRNKNFRYIRFHSKERRQMNYYSGLMVNKDRVKEIKILGLGETFITKYKTVFAKYYKGLKRIIVREGITQIIVGLLTTVVSSALFVYVAFTVVNGDGLVGDYSLYSGALTSITTYVGTLLASTVTIYEGTLFIDNMITFMKEEPKIVSISDEPLKVERGIPHKIEIKNVSFAYPGTERMVLKNLNLTIEANDSIVLVGLNGAGKTTLIKLLTRLYDPTEGEILLDGHNLKEYDPVSLYSAFGIIFQDFGHYAETVSENVRFGDIDREYLDDNIHLAARRGGAEPFINALPDGYDTPLTRMFEENGVELSGGQWQKLSVARAFYNDSEILIMDEPTASLDPIAEREVFDQYALLAKDKISVFVSHKLSSAVNATKIVVIDDGRIVEVGSHEELMRLGGSYCNLFTIQAQRYAAVPVSVDAE
ncbi:MAG: ABC transporter ATP-binding protein, partial [Clostridia bacterium]|nr:ABC transporter ATP-binding protein [Clostridia bacterium]